MIYSHHAAKVCAVIAKVAWRRGLQHIKEAANGEGSSPFKEIALEELGNPEEEEGQLLIAEKKAGERDRRQGFYSAVKTSREQQLKQSQEHLKVAAAH
jgi:hypothetical protein